MATAIAALEVAISAGELSLKIEDKIEEVVKSLDGAKALKDRYRSLELVIANDSKYNLLFKKEYFDSGTWFSQPDSIIAPGGAGHATVADRQGSVLCGVTGGMSWDIQGTGKFLILGFCNPAVGSYKIWLGVRDQPDPKYGYDHCNDDTYKLYSQNGFALLGQLKECKIADRRFVYGLRNEN